MNDDQDEAAEFDRIRWALSVYLKPNVIPTTAGQALAWMPAPHGYVPFVGTSLAEPFDRWTVPNTEITYAQLQAQHDRLRAEGLGSLVGLGWGGSRSHGGVVAWGATASDAMGRLLAGLPELWPDVVASVGAVADHEWAPGQRRVGAPGVTIIAPATRVYHGQVLLARRGFVDVSLGISGSDWRGALSQAITVDPQQLVDTFATAHRAAGHPAEDTWPLANPLGRGRALVAPVMRFWPKYAEAMAAVWR